MASRSPADALDNAPSPPALNPTPSADAAANSPLFKLAPELRHRIYRHLFGSSEAIKPVVRMSRRQSWCSTWGIGPFGYDEPRSEYYGDYNDPVKNAVHTSIFSVCRSIKAEAMDVLYGTKILRGNILDLDVMLQNKEVSGRVKWVEIKKCFSAYEETAKAQHLRVMLKERRQLPRLHSMVILSDDLSSRDTPLPVMDFVERVGLGPATCVDIARYQLEGKFKGVEIVNRKLQEMWPDVRAAPGDYDGIADALNIIDSLQASEYAYNIPTWASHTSLRCWVSIQQKFITMHKSGEWEQLVHKNSTDTFDDDTDEETTYVFLSHTIGNAMIRCILEYPLLRSGDHDLMTLKPGDDVQLLNETSEFIAVNISHYHQESVHPSIVPQLRRCPLVLGETWDDNTGKTALEYMTEQQDIALMNGASVEFILDPVINDDVPARRLIDRKLAQSWISSFRGIWARGTARGSLAPEALRQLTHLYLALTHCDQRTTGGYYHRRELWATNLLQRYLVASGSLNDKDATTVMRASIDDLRTIVSTVLDVFSPDLGYYDGDGELVQSCFVDTDVPADFNSDVFAPLGWNYGLLLANAVRRFASQDRLSLTLARQWIKERAMWQ
jgi:hypothetical protein